MTFACLAAAGAVMGMFFNGYALAASGLLVALAALLSAVNLGFEQASISMILGLISLQAGYLGGLSAAAFVSTSRRGTIPTSHIGD